MDVVCDFLDGSSASEVYMMIYLYKHCLLTPSVSERRSLPGKAEHDLGAGEPSLCVFNASTHGSLCVFVLTDVYVFNPPQDSEAGVAKALAHIHQRHRGSESYEREPLPEQHDHPKAAQ